MRNHWIIAALVGLLLPTLAAQAASVTYNASYGVVQSSPEILQSTDWSTILNLPKWNPADYPGQVLTGIVFTLTGKVRGNAQAENLGNSPTNLALNLQATITLTDPSNNTLISVIPVVSSTTPVTAFDGNADFAGTSGISFTNIVGNNTQTQNSTDFALFTGSGDILLPLIAKGTSSGSGGGSALYYFTAGAAADASVTYLYQPAVVPLPAAAFLGLPLLAGVVLRRRRTA